MSKEELKEFSVSPHRKTVSFDLDRDKLPSRLVGETSTATHSRSNSVTRQNANRGRAHARTLSNGNDIIPQIDLEPSSGDTESKKTLDDLITKSIEQIHQIPFKSSARSNSRSRLTTDDGDSIVTIRVEKARKPSLHLNTNKVDKQTELIPLLLHTDEPRKSYDSLPSPGRFSRFIEHDIDTRSPWADVPLDDPLEDVQTVNDMLDKPAKHFDGIEFKAKRKKGWSQKEIEAALIKTGLEAKAPATPMDPTRIVKRGGVKTSTTCLYEALRFILHPGYWSVLDPKITKIGDLPWTMYRYCSWVAHDKRFQERVFLIEIGRTAGFDDRGQPIYQDHIEYLGSFKSVKATGRMPLGIKMTMDMHDRMTSDGTSIKMCIFGSELFPMDPNSCTMRKTISFLSDVHESIKSWITSKKDLDTLYNVILASGVFTPVFEKHKWCHHLSANNYPDDDAYVVARNEFWYVTWHPSTLVIWSKDCVDLSTHVLPFETRTSYTWVRSIPDHDHRWAAPNNDEWDMLHVIPANKSAKWNTIDKSLNHWAGQIKKRDNSLCRCGKYASVHIELSLCIECARDELTKQDPHVTWGLYEPSSGLGQLRSYVREFHLQKDHFSHDTSTMDIHGESLGLWFHALSDKNRKIVIGVRPKQGTPYVNYIQFPIPVWHKRFRTTKDLSSVTFLTDTLQGEDLICRAANEVITPDHLEYKPSLLSQTFIHVNNMIPFVTKGSLTAKVFVGVQDFSHYSLKFPNGNQSTDLLKGDYHLRIVDPREVMHGFQNHYGHPVLATRGSSLVGSYKTENDALIAWNKLLKPVIPEVSQVLRDPSVVKLPKHFDIPGGSFKTWPVPAAQENKMLITGLKREISSYGGFYRNTEINEFRQAHFEGIHHTNFQFKESSEPNWIQSFITHLRGIESLSPGRIIKVTSSSTAKVTLYPFINFVPKGWTTPTIRGEFRIIVGSISGSHREMAVWRLLPWIYGSSHKIYHIMNGRDDGINQYSILNETTKLDMPGCYQAHNITPLILNNAWAKGGQFNNLAHRFWGSRNQFSTYGFDEAFIQETSSTVYLSNTWTENPYFLNQPWRLNLPQTKYVWGGKVLHCESQQFIERCLTLQHWEFTGFKSSITIDRMTTPESTGFPSLTWRVTQETDAQESLPTFGIKRPHHADTLEVIEHLPVHERLSAFINQKMKSWFWANPFNQFLLTLLFIIMSLERIVGYGPLTWLSKHIWFVKSWVWLVIAGSFYHRFMIVGLFMGIMALYRLTRSSYSLFTSWRPIPSLDDWTVTIEEEKQMTDKGAFIEIDTDYPDCDRNRILVGALGTRGDILPMRALALWLAKAGIPTAFRIIKQDTAADLRSVAEGTHWSHIPYFLNLQYLYKGNWKWIYGAFNNAKKTTNVQLGPSKRWVKPFNIKSTFLGIATKFLMQTVVTEFSVGVLKDSSLARSADGRSVLQKRSNKAPNDGTIRAGYVLGSDSLLIDDPVVQSLIQEYNAEPITDPNHSEAFRNYTHVICHGGAGTMQTIIASGAIAISANNELDRNYHGGCLKPEYYKQTTPLPLVVHAMYKSGKPIPWNWAFTAKVDLASAFLERIILDLVYDFLKVVLIPVVLFKWLFVLLMWSIQFKPGVWFAVPQVSWLIAVLTSFCVANPLVLLYPGHIHWIMLVSGLYYIRHGLLEDCVTFFKGKHSHRYLLQFHYVHAGFPWRLPGHLSIYDNYENERWEGRFKRRVGPQEWFYFSKSKAPKYIDDVFAFEIPLNLDVREMTKEVEFEGQYDKFFNCQTGVLNKIIKYHAMLLVPAIIAMFTGTFMIFSWTIMFQIRNFLVGKKIETIYDIPVPNITQEDPPDWYIKFTAYAAGPFVDLVKFFMQYKPEDIPMLGLPPISDDSHTESLQSVISDPVSSSQDPDVDKIIKDVDDLVICKHSMERSDCPECYTKEVTLVISEFLEQSVSRQAAELELAEPQEMRKEEIENWVKSKLSNLSNNHGRDQLTEVIGFLATVIKDSKRDFVVKKTQKDNFKTFKSIEINGRVFEPKDLEDLPDDFPIIPELNDTDYDDALLAAVYQYITEKDKVDFDDFPVGETMIAPVPRNAKESDRRHLVAVVVDKIHDLLRPLFDIVPQIQSFFEWIKNQLVRNFTYVANFLTAAEKIGELLWDYSMAMWEDFFTLMKCIIDVVFVDEYATRIKSVWAATTLVRAPALALRARLRSQITYMEAKKRGDPIEDFQEWTKGLEDTYVDIFGKKPKLLALSSSNLDSFHSVQKQMEAEGNNPLFYYHTGKQDIQAAKPHLHTSGHIVVTSHPELLDDDFIIHGLYNPSVKEGTAHKYFKYDRTTHCSSEDILQKEIQKSVVDYRSGGLFYHGLSRPIHCDMPMMTHNEAKFQGFKMGEYWSDPMFEKRGQEMRERGVPQGGDGVFFSEKYPEKNRISYSRYAPKYDTITPEEMAMNREIAQAIVDEYPEAHLKAQLTPPEAIKRYLDTKMSYSSGAPFLNDYKKRKALYDAGFDQVFIQNAYKAFRTGQYPNSCYHGFMKAQVVDVEKLAKGKDPRSVVAQDLASYYVDQVIQLERNKRVTWRTTGVGIGMILNQNMQFLFEELEDFKNLGGYYFEADATQFDSRTTPGMFDGLAQLAYLGFEWQGKDIASKMRSVMAANYTTMQDTYIFGITENPWVGLTIGVSDQNVIDRMIKLYPDKFARYYHSDLPNEPSMTPPAWWKMPFESKEDELSFDLLDETQKQNIRKCRWHGTDGLEGKIILTTHKTASPNPRTHPYFAYLTPEIPDFFDTPHLKVEKSGKYSFDETLVRMSDNLDKVYNLHLKNRGGGTGQSATSWDNTWGLRIQFIKGWMLYHDMKKTAKDFFKEAKQKNTGDDMMLVLRIKKKGFDYEKFKRCMSAVGLDLTIDIIHDIENIQYLGQRVLRLRTHPYEKSLYEDWARVKMKQSRKPLEPEPRFLVYHDQSQTEMRGSAKRYYQASIKNRRYLHADVQSLVGKATLTAWSPSLYRTLGEYYIEDLHALAKYYRIPHLQAEMTKAHTNGFTTTKNPWWQVSIKGKPTHAQMNTWRMILNGETKGKISIAEKRRYQFWSFIIANPYPSFYKVTSISMKLRKEDPDKYDKFFQRFFSDPKYSDQRMREWVDYLSNAAHALPRSWYKLQPHIGIIFPDPTFYTPEQYIEKFIWTSHGRENLTKDKFQDLLSQSPYGALTDGEVFYHNLSRPEFIEHINKYPDYIYMNMVMLITLCYMVLYPFELWIVGVPWIGLWWRIFILLMIDLPKLYSILNLLYWHYHGESSPTVSALVPRDPYVQMKRFAGLMTSIIPIGFAYLFRFDLILPFVATPLPYLADWIRKNQMFKEQPQDTFSKERPKNPWDRLSTGPDDSDFVHQFHEPGKAMVVTAATGTGKSTMLPPAVDVGDHLMRLKLPGNERIRHHVLLFPRNILVDQWDSPLVNQRAYHNRLQSYIVRRGVNIDNLMNSHGSIFLMTYGHFVNRTALHHKEFRKNTVFYLDEFHENSDDMKRCYELLNPTENVGKVIMLSATPVQVPWAETTLFESPIPQRFKKKVITFDFPPRQLVTTFLWAKDQFPDHCSPGDVIIRCVTQREVTEVINGLTELNVPCQEVSRATSNRPIDETKCLVTTQIIDAGINLKGRRLLIETGYEMKQIRGQIFYEPSSKITSKQLEGRVGRYQHGDIVIRPSWSGTGRMKEEYGSPELYTSKLVADANKVMRLTDATHRNLICNKGRFNFMAINPNAEGFTPDMKDNIFLLLELDQSIANIVDLELTYNRALKDYKAIRSGHPRTCDPNIEHIYATFNTRELYDIPYEKVNRFRNNYGGILYAIIYDDVNPCPEAAPYDPSTGRELVWDDIKSQSRVFFSVRSLYLKERRWINREGNELIREIATTEDAKESVIKLQSGKIKSLYERVLSQVTDDKAILSLKRELSWLTQRLKRQFDNIKHPILYHGRAWDSTVPSNTPQPAMVSISALACPICGATHDHMHDSRLSNLEKYRSRLIPQHPHDQPVHWYYMNPIVTTRNMSQLRKYQALTFDHNMDVDSEYKPALKDHLGEVNNIKGKQPESVSYPEIPGLDPRFKLGNCLETIPENEVWFHDHPDCGDESSSPTLSAKGVTVPKPGQAGFLSRIQNVQDRIQRLMSSITSELPVKEVPASKPGPGEKTKVVGGQGTPFSDITAELLRSRIRELKPVPPKRMVTTTQQFNPVAELMTHDPLFNIRRLALDQEARSLNPDQNQEPKMVYHLKRSRMPGDIKYTPVLPGESRYDMIIRAGRQLYPTVTTHKLNWLIYYRYIESLRYTEREGNPLPFNDYILHLQSIPSERSQQQQVSETSSSSEEEVPHTIEAAPSTQGSNSRSQYDHAVELLREEHPTWSRGQLNWFLWGRYLASLHRDSQDTSIRPRSVDEYVEFLRNQPYP